jgi:lipopolysaccharide transport system ATP-binding protein
MKGKIRISALSKSYKIKRPESYKSLRESLARAFSLERLFRSRAARTEEKTPETLWALKDVSFEIQPGETLGIIGPNGAGKSTLLKVLSRITAPSSGEVEIFGRVSSLLEVGTGFNPELTGRENIFLNAAILGMKSRDVKRKFDEIVDFSEVERFIDTPVKHYSSGMYLRLAFAVAAHLEPEILLVDEVLAVGDIRFQKKCLEKVGDVSQQGRTVVFVSHHLPSVVRLCSRAIYLDHGCLIEDGHPHSVIASYLKPEGTKQGLKEWSSLDTAPGDDTVRLRAVSVTDKSKKCSDRFDIGESIGVHLKYDVLKGGATLVHGARLVNQEGVILFQVDDWNPEPREEGVHETTLWIPGHILAEGTFYLSVHISTPSPRMKRVKELDVLSFQTADHTDIQSIRKMWSGDLPGAIRPNWRWETTVSRLKLKAAG